MKKIFAMAFLALTFAMGCEPTAVEPMTDNQGVDIQTSPLCDRFEIIEEETESGILIHTTRFTDVSLSEATTMTLEGYYTVREGTGIDQLTTVTFQEEISESWELPQGDYRVVCLESWKLYTNQQIQWIHEENYETVSFE